MKVFVGKYWADRGVWCDSTTVKGQPYISMVSNCYRPRIRFSS